MSRIVWPGSDSSGFENWQRADELWKHTCFEAFGRIGGVPGYYEVNFATSANWAAFGFADYRKGMRQAGEIGLTQAYWRIRERQGELSAIIQIPREFLDQPLEMGLSAVIEEEGGAISYWALAHPDGKPDFHHPACFAAVLPAPGTS